MIAWPPALVKEVARRRAVIFLGAGVSKNSVGDGGKRPPDWSEFLQKAIDRCTGPRQHIKALMSQFEYLTVCEIVKEKLREDYFTILEEEFVAPRYQAAEIHRHIFALDARIVATQNFDKIFDTFAQASSSNSVKVKQYTDEDLPSFLRGDHRVIIKVHGTIDRPDKMIFTRSEYARARFEHHMFYDIMDALALTHTFVFVGCGLVDPDMKLLLERQAHLFKASTPHYIILPKSRALHTDVVQSIRENMNLRVVPYDARNYHEQLTLGLEDLSRLVEAERADIAARQLW